MAVASLIEKIRELPEQPGIYIFKDVDGVALYVGKAKSLRKRVVNYLNPDPERRLGTMIEEARTVDFLVTDSEAEALLLENNWIKKRQPRYNIRLRDDKTYPYLKLTVNEEYPRLAFTRRIRDDGAAYFGPFLPGGLARRAIKLVQKLFQVRVCHIEIDGKLPRPCLYYDMKRCLGPCVDGLTDHTIYARAVEQANLFLAGKNQQLLRTLRREMKAVAEALEFERAGQLRDTISEVESISQARKLSSARGEDVDIYGVCVSGENAAVTVFVMRRGQVLDRREYFWEGQALLSERRLLSELLPQIYDRTTFIPKEIQLPRAIDGDEALMDWLSQRKGQRVRIQVPARGAKAERVRFAMRNASMSFRRRFRLGAEEMAGAESLRSRLRLEEAPRRIEGFDISTHHGGETVASLVAWEAGNMKKSSYRSFNIRGLRRADDFESMRQAVERAYRRRLLEVAEMPDLILVDGGRGQLNAALEALSSLGVEETPIVGLAKREEEIYLADHPEPLRLERRDPGLRLLQKIRDESHRFALSRHRRRRSARMLKTRFDSLPGVGFERKKLLVRRFKSFAGLERAQRQEIQEVVGPAVGGHIFDHLHPDPRGCAATAAESRGEGSHRLE